MSQRRVAIACAVFITAALSVSALRAQGEIRGDAVDTVDGTIAYVNDVFPDGPALIVVAHLEPGGNSRLFWRSDDSIEVLTTLALEALPTALAKAAAAGREDLIVVTDATPTDFDAEMSRHLAEMDWRVLDASSTPGGDSNLILVGPR